MMAALTLNTTQVQLLNSMEDSVNAVFEDGIIAPGGTPPVLPGFDGYKNYTLEQKTLGLNSIKSTFTPFLVAMGEAPVYETVTTFENDFSAWGDANYGEGLVRYAKDITGYVRLHGLVRTPSDGGDPIGSVMFILPAGYIPGPGDGSIHSCVADNSFCSVSVNEFGEVTLRSSVANDTWVSLEIRFFAGG